MKNHLILFAGIFFTAFALISGCTKTTEVTTVEPVSTGRIEGTVQLEEMDCTPSASSAGVTVAILGTKFTAISDSTGTFTFYNVPAGYYSFQFSKSGFTTSIQSSVPFVGSGTLVNYVSATLARIDDYKVTLGVPNVSKIAITQPPDSEFQLTFPAGGVTTVDSLGNDISPSIWFFLSKSPAINYMDTSTYFEISYADGGFSIPVNPNGPHSGDTLYIVCYPTGCVTGLLYHYDVGDTAKIGYYGLGPPSNVIHFVLP